MYRRATPEQCRYDCDSYPSCFYYRYDPVTFECGLYAEILYPGAGVVAGTNPVRTCFKTPQHPDLSASGLGRAQGSLCFPGVDLGGVKSNTLPGYFNPTSCAVQCAMYGCGHWSLRTDSTCELFAPYTYLGMGAGAAIPYGVDNTTVMSCLARVTGSFECLAPNRTIAYESAGAVTAATLADCGASCYSSGSCIGFTYTTAATSNCFLMADKLFFGTSGSNGLASGTDDVTTCLRTTMVRQLFGDPPPVASPPPPEFPPSTPMPPTGGGMTYPPPPGISAFTVEMAAIPIRYTPVGAWTTTHSYYCNE